jgi:DNA-binding NtrC family response regulator
MVQHVLEQETPQHQTPPALDAEATRVLTTYTWPGNVRELENAMKHAMTFAEDNRITRDCLPPKIVDACPAPAMSAESTSIDLPAGTEWLPLKDFLRRKEAEYITTVLQQTGGDKEKAAKCLQISLATLYRKLPEPATPNT